MQKKSSKRKPQPKDEPRLYMTKDGKRPLTPRGAGRRVVAAMKAARERYIEVANNARALESLIVAANGKKTVAYALRAILVELSNESGVGVDSPGVAGNFYQAAAFELRDSADIHIQQTLRHLEVLLSNPTFKTASALINYWDDHRSKDRKTDPFPAKPDPFAVTNKKRLTLRDRR